MKTMDAHRAPLRRRCPRYRPWWAGLAIWLLLLGACGYGPDQARLPGDARSLSIGIIQNRTNAGELDVRLHSMLRQRLLRHPNIIVTSPDKSNLLLETRLNELRIVRERDVSSATVTSLSYTLLGDFSLLDQRDGVYWWSRQPVTASAALNFNVPTLETPAVQDEALNDTLERFADQLERYILTAF